MPTYGRRLAATVLVGALVLWVGLIAMGTSLVAVDREPNRLIYTTCLISVVGIALIAFTVLATHEIIAAIRVAEKNLQAAVGSMNVDVHGALEEAQLDGYATAHAEAMGVSLLRPKSHPSGRSRRNGAALERP